MPRRTSCGRSGQAGIGAGRSSAHTGRWSDAMRASAVPCAQTRASAAAGYAATTSRRNIGVRAGNERAVPYAKPSGSRRHLFARAVLRRLMERGELRDGGAISVQLVAVPANNIFRKPDLVLELRKIELLITPIVVRPTRK